MSLTEEQIDFLHAKAAQYFALERDNIVFVSQAEVDKYFKHNHEAGSINGYVAHFGDSRYQIVISRDQSVGCAFQTILHEMAHVQLNHVGPRQPAGFVMEKEKEASILAYEYLYYITKLEVVEEDRLLKAENLYRKALEC